MSQLELTLTLLNAQVGLTQCLKDETHKQLLETAVAAMVLQ